MMKMFSVIFGMLTCQEKNSKCMTNVDLTTQENVIALKMVKKIFRLLEILMQSRTF